MRGVNRRLWKERFGEYLELRQFSPRTIAGHLGELEDFLDYLECEGVETLSRLTREHLEGYRVVLFHRVYQGRRLMMQTQKAKLCRIRCFCRFLVSQRYLLVDPSRELELPRDETTLPRVLLSETEVERLLETPDPSTPLGLRDRTMLELFYSSGIRTTEARNLTGDAIHLEDRFVHIVYGKGRKSRLVPMGAEASYWLARYLRVGRPQLVTDPAERRTFLSKNGLPMARANIAHMVGRTGVKAGLEKRVTPHVLRHACATHMLRRGAGLRHLQELLGHASPDTTQIYTRLELSDLQWVHRRYHPRGRQA